MEELLAQGVFVVLFGLPGFGAQLGLLAAGCLPGVEVGDGVFDGGELLFVADGGDPVLRRRPCTRVVCDPDLRLR